MIHDIYRRYGCHDEARFVTSLLLSSLAGDGSHSTDQPGGRVPRWPSLRPAPLPPSSPAAWIAAPPCAPPHAAAARPPPPGPALALPLRGCERAGLTARAAARPSWPADPPRPPRSRAPGAPPACAAGAAKQGSPLSSLCPTAGWAPRVRERGVKDRFSLLSFWLKTSRICRNSQKNPKNAK